MGGAKEFFNFNDYLSSLNWIYIVQSKDDVFGKLKDFKPSMENHIKTKDQLSKD